MAYITTINDQTYTIETDENGQQRSITLEEHAHIIDWKKIAALAADAKGNISAGGLYSVLIGGTSYEVFARRITKAGEKDSQTYEILIGGQRFEVKVEDERTRKLAGLARSGAHSGAATVQAPMPGLVVSTPLEAGVPVKQGQTVVVLEAMKMENDLTSPINGTLVEVRVQKGQTVDQGEVLAVIEGES
ncbi:MAG TPA: biotin/lipoyl-containing protein [Ktedonosporobacter sp.]|jgi:biotin carboxyl carrier protein|nr:biotin/lipoyl-containing protein [Ktedonosporobacter sp.]